MEDNPSTIDPLAVPVIESPHDDAIATPIDVVPLCEIEDFIDAYPSASYSFVCSWAETMYPGIMSVPRVATRIIERFAASQRLN